MKITCNQYQGFLTVLFGVSLFFLLFHSERKYQSLVIKIDQHSHHKELPCRIKPFLNISKAQETIIPYSIAIAIFSVERPNAPDFLYAQMSSIFDAIMVDQPYLNVDSIHIFDGTVGKNGTQVQYFKYLNHVKVHPLPEQHWQQMRMLTKRRKATFNYLLALKSLIRQYSDTVHAYLVLEDDVIFDPDAAYIIWRVLKAIEHIPLFLVDGYVRGNPQSISEELEALHSSSSSPVEPFLGFAKCCSQSYLFSPKALKRAIPLIEKSLDGSVVYRPLDLYLTGSLHGIFNFHFYLSKVCWVQHVGYPYLGLGRFHRGCSRMTFESNDKESLRNLTIIKQP